MSKLELLLRTRLETLGATVEARPAPPFGRNTLIGTLKGSGQPKLMMLVHYDTVFGV